MIKVIDNFLDSDVYYKLKSMFSSVHVEFTKYTEHNGRTGFEITDKDIIDYFDGYLKRKIMEQLEYDDNDIEVSAIYLCKDDVDFHMPIHNDDIYKKISCVIYFGEGFSGTVFLGDYLQKFTIDSIENRCVCFTSSNNLHYVPKSHQKRYTLQFHYKLSQE